jgi:hypothetical protein
MKKINKYYIILMFLVFGSITSCDKGFDEMNVNPVDLTSVDPAFQLNYAIINSASTYSNLQYETIIVKQMINPFSGVGAAAQYNQDNRSVTSANWTRYYGTVIRDLTDVVEHLKDFADRSNLYNMARIWKAYSYMVLTDSYGEIPYTESGLGYLEGVVLPVYGTQEFIYQDILNELESAAASLDLNKPTEGRDILYAGDLTKWKRLANSLILRAAMRLSKVNTGLATKYVTSAISGGLMSSNDDNAFIVHNANFPNPIGIQLNGGQSFFFYMARDFIDYLSITNDPRLASISVRYIGAESGTAQTEGIADRTPAAQIGMPIGYDNTTISEAVAADNLVSLYEYSQLDRTRMGGSYAPSFFVTYAQTQLLLAEAVVRGWASGDASTLYSEGIRAHMIQLATYGTSTAVPVTAINDYVQANTLDPANSLENINTQYWIASFLNGPEAFANFRRSGFPILTPNPYPGTDLKSEDFIRRLTYPDSEHNVNNENVQQAITNQGPDILDTRVWWDVK